MIRKITGAVALCSLVSVAHAQTMDHEMADPHAHHKMDAGMDSGKHQGHHGHMMHSSPIGVMGNHVMPEGKLMVRYTYGHMDMSGLRLGNDKISSDTAATTVPNANPGPATMRVIPHHMEMDMHMFSAMYGATERLTFMGMVPYIEKRMKVDVYKGMMGTNVLGRDERSSKGIGDIRVGAIWGVAQQEHQSITAMMGLSLPTGSITKRDDMLMPNGMMRKGRLGYPMQLGSGTIDLTSALTWQRHHGSLGFGAQASGVIHLGENDQGYTLGDSAAVTAWGSYQITPVFNVSGRVEASHQARIRGRDSELRGPAPGADPDAYGRDVITLYAGLDITPRTGVLKGHKLGAEIGLPVYQDLNGLGLKRDWGLRVAWRKGF